MKKEIPEVKKAPQVKETFIEQPNYDMPVISEQK